MNAAQSFAVVIFCILAKFIVFFLVCKESQKLMRSFSKEINDFSSAELGQQHSNLYIIKTELAKSVMVETIASNILHETLLE